MQADKLAKEGKVAEGEALIATMEKLLSDSDYAGLRSLIEAQKIVCAVSGTGNWTSTESPSAASRTPATGTDSAFCAPRPASGPYPCRWRRTR